MSTAIEMQVAAALTASHQRLDQLEQMIERAEAHVQRISNVAEQVVSMAACVSAGAGEDPTQAVGQVLAVALNPLERILADSSEALHGSIFAANPGQAVAAVVEAVHLELTEQIEAIGNGLSDAADGVSAAITELREHATTALQAAQVMGSAASDQAEMAHTALVDGLRQLVPQMSEQVAALMSEHLSARITHLAESAEKSLADLEGLVNEVAGDLVSKLGGPAQVLEQITQVVDDIEPALQLFDELA